MCGTPGVAFRERPTQDEFEDRIALASGWLRRDHSIMATPTEPDSAEPADATSRAEWPKKLVRRGVNWIVRFVFVVRRTSKWIGRRFFLAGGLNSDALLTRGNLVAAFLMTAVVFFCWNTYWTRVIDGGSEDHLPKQLKPATAGPQTLIKIGWVLKPDSREGRGEDTKKEAKGGDEADKRKLGRRRQAENMWLDLFGEKDQARTLLMALTNLIGPISKNSQGDRVHVKKTVKTQVTGQRRGWPIFWITSKPVDSETVWSNLVDELAIEPSSQSDKSEKDEYNKKELAIAVLDSLVKKTHEDLRALKQLSGGIQWFTVFVFWMTSIACLRRLILLWRLKGPEPEVESWLDRVVVEIQQVARKGNGNGQDQSQQALIDERLRHFQEETEERIYSRFNFLVGVLPSLGFIGTILGMGEALLKADQLVKSTNKQLAIQSMTQELGMAFDTTLVALICALLAGVAVVLLRRYEHDVFDDRIKVIQQEAGISLD